VTAGLAPIRTAALLATGEELVRGAVVDTNSAWLARKLRPLGVEVVEVRVVGDGLAPIRDAAVELAARVGLVVVGGGIGPTEDDRTREALANAAGVELVVDAEAQRQVAAFFARLGRTPSPSNARQASLPRGATVVENPVGSAPGFSVAIGRATVVALPGVPSEFRAMVESALLPWVAARRSEPVETRFLQVVGLPESVVGERIGRWMTAPPPPLVSMTVEFGVVHVCASDRGDAAGRARLDRCAAELRTALGDHLFSDRDETLAQLLVRELARRGQTVAVAESCTGGLVSAAFTDVPGSSDVLLEGCVVYTEAAKRRTLGVTEESLARHGAVSEVVARELAENVRRRTGATFGLSTTGVAGPSGGTAATPVGTVHLAVASERATVHVARRLPGDRDSVRRFAVVALLDLLRREMR
jgi:nicotinamide-nucleotide amidase